MCNLGAKYRMALLKWCQFKANCEPFGRSPLVQASWFASSLEASETALESSTCFIFTISAKSWNVWQFLFYTLYLRWSDLARPLDSRDHDHAWSHLARLCVMPLWPNHSNAHQTWCLVDGYRQMVHPPSRYFLKVPPLFLKVFNEEFLNGPVTNHLAKIQNVQFYFRSA